MENSIKTVHKNILERFNLLIDVTNKKSRIDKMIEKYIINTTHLLYEDDDKNYDEYMKIDNNIGITREIENLFLEIQKSIRMYNLLPNAINKTKDVQTCVNKCCKTSELIIHDNSLICKNCGEIHDELYEIFLIPKSFDYLRYFRRWITKLFDVYKTPKSSHDIHEIILKMKHEKLTNIHEVRDYLKRNKLSKLNERAGFFLYNIQEDGPDKPTRCLDMYEINNLEQLFGESMLIFEKVKSQSNRIYYGFVIYKLIEQFYPQPEKTKWLQYIYLQSPATIKKNDRIWKKICEISNGLFVYKPSI